MSKHRTFACAVFGAAVGLLGACVSPPEQPASDTRDEQLTPERAKTALLEMMRSKPGKDLGWFDVNVPEEMSKLAIEEEDNGWYAWGGAFRVHPAREAYTFTVRPRTGARACMFEYEGSFVMKDGRWQATPPTLIRTAGPAGD